MLRLVTSGIGTHGHSHHIVSLNPTAFVECLKPLEDFGEPQTHSGLYPKPQNPKLEALSSSNARPWSGVLPQNLKPKQQRAPLL